VLREVEWGGEVARQEGANICPACGAYAGLFVDAPQGDHLPDCRLAAFLRAP